MLFCVILHYKFEYKLQFCQISLTNHTYFSMIFHIICHMQLAMFVNKAKTIELFRSQSEISEVYSGGFIGILVHIVEFCAVLLIVRADS